MYSNQSKVFCVDLSMKNGVQLSLCKFVMVAFESWYNVQTKWINEKEQLRIKYVSSLDRETITLHIQISPIFCNCGKIFLPILVVFERSKLIFWKFFPDFFGIGKSRFDWRGQMSNWACISKMDSGFDSGWMTLRRCEVTCCWNGKDSNHYV